MLTTERRISGNVYHPQFEFLDNVFFLVELHKSTERIFKKSFKCCSTKTLFRKRWLTMSVSVMSSLVLPVGATVPQQPARGTCLCTAVLKDASFCGRIVTRKS